MAQIQHFLCELRRCTCWCNIRLAKSRTPSNDANSSRAKFLGVLMCFVFRFLMIPDLKSARPLNLVSLSGHSTQYRAQDSSHATSRVSSQALRYRDSCPFSASKEMRKSHQLLGSSPACFVTDLLVFAVFRSCFPTLVSQFRMEGSASGEGQISSVPVLKWDQKLGTQAWMHLCVVRSRIPKARASAGYGTCRSSLKPG